MTRSVGLALAVVILATACTHHGRADSAPTGPLRIVNGLTSGFGVNDGRIAWEGAGQVVVADLDSGRRVAVANGAGGSPVAMAL